TYDLKKIGKRITWGRSHSVYHYGESEIIKFPRLEKLLGALLVDRLSRDISVCKKYFAGFFLDTRLVHAPDSEKLAVIQPYITGHYLSKEDMKNTVVQQEFKNLMERYDS